MDTHLILLISYDIERTHPYDKKYEPNQSGGVKKSRII